MTRSRLGHGGVAHETHRAVPWIKAVIDWAAGFEGAGEPLHRRSSRQQRNDPEVNGKSTYIVPPRRQTRGAKS